MKDKKVIPVINTALPRANQYFAAWHEVYHLLFNRVSFNHFIECDNTLEERKADTSFMQGLKGKGLSTSHYDKEKADRQQASIVFDVAKQMVEMSPALDLSSTGDISTEK